jgi:hypothetical protein
MSSRGEHEEGHDGLQVLRMETPNTFIPWRKY